MRGDTLARLASTLESAKAIDDELAAQGFSLLAGFLGERCVAVGANVEAARTDVAEATKFIAGIDLDELVLKVRHRLAVHWTEIDRLALALDKHGELDEGEILRTIRTPTAWLQS
jgi:hypothetical protein